VYGDRIRQARELCSLTQTELAKSVGVPQSAIAQIESDAYTPSDSVLQAIAIRTGFDLPFLKQDTPPAEFPFVSALYRAQVKVKPKEKALAHRTVQLMFEIVQLMRPKLREIAITVPRTSEPPEVCAGIARASFGLSPGSPIPNLVNVVERAGVMILQPPLDIDGLDGFSAWVGPNHDIPLICLLPGKCGYRPRFTLAEELCHLIKHTPLRCSVKEADAEARRFAGELLLPEDAVRESVTQSIGLASLLPLKARYKVSLQFVIRRVLDLSMITDNQYRYLNMQIGSRGWKKEEPGDSAVLPERPRLFAKMIEVVYGNPPDFVRMKRDMGGAPVSLLKSLVGINPSEPEPEPSRRVISFGGRPS
jgi:Zn-dependent peptidase ImmA (M78 family)/transcriptional regulator with XRE-family HTH domain